MDDNKKRDVAIAVGIPIILWFLFRGKNSSAIGSNGANGDNSPLSIPTFNPSDYFSGNNPANGNSLGDKYIPLFGFIANSKGNQISPVSYTPTTYAPPVTAPAPVYQPTTYAAPVYVPPPVVQYVAPILSKLVLPQPVAPQPIAPYVQPAPPIVALTPTPIAAPIVKPVAPVAENIVYIDSSNGGITQQYADMYSRTHPGTKYVITNAYDSGGGGGS